MLNPEVGFIHALLLRLWSASQHHQHHLESVGNIEESLLPSQIYWLRICTLSGCPSDSWDFENHCQNSCKIQFNDSWSLWATSKPSPSKSFSGGQLWVRLSRPRYPTTCSHDCIDNTSLYQPSKSLSSLQTQLWIEYTNYSIMRVITKQVPLGQTLVLTKIYSYHQGFHRNYIQGLCIHMPSCQIKWGPV